jgi:hypothetical protein
MNDTKYIGLDVHQATISATALHPTGKLVKCECAIGINSAAPWAIAPTRDAASAEWDEWRRQYCRVARRDAGAPPAACGTRVPNQGNVT